MLRFIRINENFEPKLTITGRTLLREDSKEIDGGTLYYKEYSTPEGIRVYSIGFKGPDQWWSSSSTSINKHFGLRITECGMVDKSSNYPDTTFAGQVSVEDLEKFIPDVLEWKKCKWTGAIQLFSKVEFPSRNDYFRSTVLDKEGKLVLPTIK